MKKNILYAVAFLVTLATLSCNNWLEVKPKGENEKEAFYSSENGFKKALIGCYVKMKDKELYGLALTATSIEYFAQHWEPNNNDLNTALMNLDVENQELKDEVEKIYKKQYNLIVQVNDLLGHLETSGEVIKDKSLRNMIKGEALAIRAFCHFDILRIFGQLPKNSTINVSLPYSQTVTIEQIPFYNFEQFIGLVIKDLTAAEAILKESDPLMKFSFSQLNSPNILINKGAISDDFVAYRKTRLNYYAVQALLARVYLYSGNYNKAYESAMSVINAKDAEGKNVIELNTADLGQYLYTSPSETLFNLHVYNLETYMNPLFRNPDFVLDAKILIEKRILSELFNNVSSDARMALWYAQKVSSGSTLLSVKKYWQMNGDIGMGVSQQVIPLLRLSELYLIAAESLNEMNAGPSNGANAVMRELKTSRNINTTDYPDAASKTQLATEILQEYQREFWAEGQMFYTHKRLGTVKMQWGSNEISEANYIMPLPKTETKR